MCDKYNITISLNTKRFYSLSCFILAVEFFAVLKSRAYIYKRGVKLRASVLCVNLDRSKLCIDFFKSFFFGCKLLLAQPKVRRQWDRFILHAPVVGVLNRKICTARFASTLSNLYGSGVPIITTLAAARDAIGNRWIASAQATACRRRLRASTVLK